LHRKFEIRYLKKSTEEIGLSIETKFHYVKVNLRATPAARWMARREGVDLSSVAGSGPEGVILNKDVESFKIAAAAINTREKMGKMRSSSLARKLAEKKNISLEGIQGTGIRGRIMMGDVIRATDKTVISTKRDGIFGQTLLMSQMRRVIAKRMSQSAFTAPHIYFFTEVEMDSLNQLKFEIQVEFEKEFKIRVSINDFFIKLVALAIREFPLINAMIKGDEIYVMPEINIGLAVALEEGLIVPAIPQADQLGLGKIAQMRLDLVERARAGRLKFEEIDRGTFTISSLAQFDITFFTAILNPPQSGILSIGKSFERLAFKNSQVIAKEMACFGLSVDHRIIDGAVAAAFLQSLKNKLEHPTVAFTKF
jgi:pyruvate dehydrogenase E2 component (dihydrolipoamide acetyltransferase)